MNAYIFLTVAVCLLQNTCWAQKPGRCKGPPLYSGAFTLGSQDGKVWTNARYAYDGIGQRIRLGEMGTYNHTSFTVNTLYLYKEKVMYEIHEKNQTCIKRPLTDPFQPVEIPPSATFVSQEVIGTLSAPGQGLLVNTWWGDMPDLKNHWLLTVTEYGCLPVSALIQTKELGWISISYYNNVIGVDDPSVFDPPPFCKDAKMEDSNGGGFFSAFH